MVSRWLIVGGVFAIYLTFFASLLVYRYDGLSLLRDEQLQQVRAKQQISGVPVIKTETEKKNLHLFKKFQLEGIARPLTQAKPSTFYNCRYYDHYIFTASIHHFFRLASRGPPEAFSFLLT